MKTNAKLILLQPSLHSKQPTIISASHRFWLLAFLSILTFACIFNLITAVTNTARKTGSDNIVTPNTANSPLPESVFDTLVHYASLNSTNSSSSRMSRQELSSVAAVLRKCNSLSSPCNFLVFGLTHETFLWKSLNNNGRTVFIADNAYIISRLEERHPEIEAYDVQYTTKVSELYEVLEYSNQQVRNECRPVQDLLFSDCKVAINDLPNFVYDLPWDLILIDGPLGNSPNAPGRISAIFTAGVLARSKKGGADGTHVFVHQIGRELEKVSSEEFLCRENLVDSIDTLGHFVVGKMEENIFEYCSPNASSIK